MRAQPSADFSRPRYKKRARKRSSRLIVLLLLLLAAAGGAAYLAPGLILSSWGEETALVIGNAKIGFNLVRADQREIYLAVEPLRDYLDPYFFWDAAEKTAVITTADRVIHMRSEQLTAEVNLQPVELQFPLREENGRFYLPLLFLADFYGLNVQYHPETDTVVIDRKGEAAYLAEISVASVRLREGPGLHYPYLAQLQQGEKVRLEEKTGSGWCLVRTAAGLTGYLPWNRIEVQGAYPSPSRTGEPGGLRPPGLPPPLVLVWEFTYPNPNVETIGAMPSLQVVSPTWFHLADENGGIKNLADPAYVHWAVERGYSVWALVSNSFDPEMTAAFLSSSARRRTFIDQLLIFARLYNLGGLNLDFENFHYSYGELYTQLIRELAPLCRAEGLVLSVDVTMISDEPYWSRGYDRGALAEAADYIMLMAYDEHWGGSPLPGSVASLPWVERGLRKVLDEVPPEKLILAVPFYTRLWQVENKGGSEVSISSRAYSMDRVEEILSAQESRLEWDNAARQNVARYTDGAEEYVAWLEDSDSMRQRLELVNRYRLAGVACWRRGLEKPEIWDLFEEVLAEYQQANQKRGGD
ncbi:MAG: glycosyl hydrolase family 18 protein [Bacillota bacterium]